MQYAEPQLCLSLLIFLVPLDNFLEVLHGHRLKRRQIYLAVHGQERVNLQIVSVLRRERVSSENL